MEVSLCVSMLERGSKYPGYSQDTAQVTYLSCVQASLIEGMDAEGQMYLCDVTLNH